MEIFFDSLEMLLDIILTENKQCIITGDFNIDTLVDSNHSNQLKDILHSFCIENMVNEPTRVQGASATCLDHCYTNCAQKTQIKINKNTLSDHFGLEIKQNTPKRDIKNSDVKKRKFLTLKLQQKLDDLLSKENWCSFGKAVGTDDKYDKFHSTLISHIDNVIPVTQCRFKDTKKPETDKITIELQEQVKLFEELLFHHPENAEYKEALRISKSKLADYINYKTCQQNTKSINEAANKSKTTWKVVYNNINKVNAKVHKITHINVDNKKINEPNSIANSFNKQFIDKPRELGAGIENKDSSTSNFIKNYFNENSFFVAPTTPLEVVKVINSLKNSGAYDIYDLSTHIIKSTANHIATPISEIFNCSIMEGVFPSKLKYSKVVPIYKNSDTHDLNNYRPISILPIISKIFEKLFLIRLQQFLSQFEILSDSQHGFRKNHSTTTAAFQFLEKIYESFDKSDNVLGLFIDLSKAFDLVNHLILLDKLYRMGIRGVAYEWIKSYLSNRKQRVYINTSEGMGCSDSIDVTQGVPQGSIIVPLLYILYVNDFKLNFPDVDMICYADDTSFIIRNIREDTVSLEAKNLLLRCKNWLNNQNLVMNETKTAVILFQNSSNTIDCNIEFENVSIACTEHTKFLGLTVDNNLKWKEHINKLCNKLSSSLFALRTLRGKVESRTLIQVYHALFESHLMYGIIFWGNSSSLNILRVFKLQKKAIRLLADLKFRDSCKYYFKELNILTIVNLYILNLLVFIKNNADNISIEPVNHEYPTRNKNSFLRPLKHHTSIYEKSVSYSGVKLFNMLPINIRCLDIVPFKKRLKMFLLGNPMYNISEFDVLDKSGI